MDTWFIILCLVISAMLAFFFYKRQAPSKTEEPNFYASKKIPKGHDGTYSDMSLFFIHDKDLSYAWREISVSDPKSDDFIVLGFVLQIDAAKPSRVIRREKIIWDGEIRRVTHRNLFQLSSLDVPYYFLHTIDNVHRAYVVHPKVPDQAQLLLEVPRDKELVFSHEYQKFNGRYQRSSAKKQTYLYVTIPKASEPTETYLISFKEGRSSVTWQKNAPNILNKARKSLSA